MLHRTCILVFLIISFAMTSPLSAQLGGIGFIKSMSGDVILTSTSEIQTKATANMRLNPGDTITTGSKSSAGLIFEDDTVVSMGPNSTMVIENYQFNPAEKQLSFVSRLAKGTFSFITGQLAKLAPQNIKLETPDATLGVRGTKFIVEVQ